MAVYTYSRVSTKAQAEDGEFLGVQDWIMQGYAMMHGYVIAGSFTERAISGGKPFISRPEDARASATMQRAHV